MKLFKWKKGERPVFPKFIESLFGKKIKDAVNKDENVSNVPQVNVEDKTENFKLTMALPGFRKEDIKIEVEQNVLNVYSDKTVEEKEESKNYIRQEFAYEAFKRSFILPENAKTNDIIAKYENGILTIEIPVEAHYKSKTIKVK
ncbi:MAG: Hsp20/alpha crystallin family protein [Vicingaceae bacterium]